MTALDIFVTVLWRDTDQATLSSAIPPLFLTNRYVLSWSSAFVQICYLSISVCVNDFENSTFLKGPISRCTTSWQSSHIGCTEEYLTACSSVCPSVSFFNRQIVLPSISILTNYTFCYVAKNSRTAKRIFMKFDLDVMPLQAKATLISYNR
jgi:hypothetical protein